MNVLKMFAVFAVLSYATTAYALPNLVPSPQAPYGPFYVGQMPYFNYTLANTGPDNTGTAPPGMNSNWVVVDGFSDNYYPSGKTPDGAWLWSSDNFGPVPAGGSVTIHNGGLTVWRWPENDWCVPLGTHRVKFEADHDNDVPETNNGDNTTAWTTFTGITRPTTAPDLTVATTTATFGPFIASTTATFPYRISNIGSAMATVTTRATAQVDLYADNASPHVDMVIKNYPILPVGSSTIFNFTWSKAVAGVHRVRVKYVDDRHSVDEQNECNNTTAWTTFTVIAANIEGRITSRTVTSGTTLSTTTFSIRNTSSIDVPAYPYRVSIDGVVVGSGTTSSGVTASTTWASVIVPINWTAPASAATQTLSYVLEITDPTNGLESTTSTITVPPTAGPIPRLISCPSALSIILGNSSNATARYWVDQPVVPTCSSGGYTDVTNGATWLSADMAVASVTNSGTRGQVTGHSIGITSVVASYSSLFATTSVSVIANPITLAIAPTSRFVRSGSTAGITVRISANINLDCVLTGGVATPVNFAHTANAGELSYGPYTTRSLTATQKVSVTCTNPLNPAETATQSVDIEIVPVAREV